MVPAPAGCRMWAACACNLAVMCLLARAGAAMLCGMADAGVVWTVSLAGACCCICMATDAVVSAVSNGTYTLLVVSFA